jgi:hypothetical protein
MRKISNALISDKPFQCASRRSGNRHIFHLDTDMPVKNEKYAGWAGCCERAGRTRLHFARFAMPLGIYESRSLSKRDATISGSRREDAAKIKPAQRAKNMKGE